MTEDLVRAAAYASSFVVMGLVMQSTIKKQGNRPALRFGAHKNQFISGFIATVIIAIEILIAGVISELVVKPHITILYDQNSGRMIEIFFASFMGAFLHLWRPRLAKKHRPIFVILCIVAGYLLFNGLQVLPP